MAYNNNYNNNNPLSFGNLYEEDKSRSKQFMSYVSKDSKGRAILIVPYKYRHPKGSAGHSRILAARIARREQTMRDAGFNV